MPLYLKRRGVIQCLFQVELTMMGVTEKMYNLPKCMTFDDVRTKGIDGPLVLLLPTN